ncbi:Alpha-N-acetylglucosaminidase [Sesamum alatum]|uniref:Alpha-N-acetylglucosaminidase n=1 Tax=Sesamum alatum TaxID=300844 RepID=A0AAE1XQB5_9LAMI|nr:Alpha-N-acetylglucosaminidase [Sesamum alatum]
MHHSSVCLLITLVVSFDNLSARARLSLYYFGDIDIRKIAFSDHLAGMILVALTRPSLSKLANEVYLSAIHAFRDKDTKALSFHSLNSYNSPKTLVHFLLLMTVSYLALGLNVRKNVCAQRKDASNNVYDNTKYVQSKLHDYAQKFWAGLLEACYLPRAAMHFKRLLKCSKENEGVEKRADCILKQVASRRGALPSNGPGRCLCYREGTVSGIFDIVRQCHG